MKVLMVGVHEKTKGGMWTVAKQYLDNKELNDFCDIKYIATATVGNPVKRGIYSVFGLLRAYFCMVTQKYDIVHVHMSERLSVFRKGAVIKMAKKRHVKVVIHMHGAEFQTWYEGLDSEKQTRVKEILNMADAVIILGEYWREFVSSLMKEKNKVKVVYNSVDAVCDNEYPLDSKKILFLGSVCARKGIYDLLEAMAIVVEKDKDISLDIYGPDNTEEGIDNLIRKYSLESAVSYKGWLDGEKKQKILNREIALNILPSYNEGLPMTILETMGSGIPNISTKVAAIPEVINKYNGYLENPGDSKAIAKDILGFFDDSKNRTLMSKRCKKDISERFSIDKNIETVKTIYQEIL